MPTRLQPCVVCLHSPAAVAKCGLLPYSMGVAPQLYFFIIVSVLCICHYSVTLFPRHCYGCIRATSGEMSSGSKMLLVCADGCSHASKLKTLNPIP